MGNGTDYKERTLVENGNVLNLSCDGSYTALYICQNSADYRTEHENFTVCKLS